jgi:hypothetical protein
VFAAAAGFFALLLWAAPGFDSTWDWTRFGIRPPPVLVVVVGDPRKLADVRAAVKPAEILAESKGAFALRHRHLVAASFEDVGPLLQKAGWQDAPLELVGPMRAPEPRLPAASPSNRELADLSQKPRLSELEARRLLELLE